MNPYIAAAIASVIAVIFKIHLSVTASGATIVVSVPWMILVIALAAVLVLFWLILRSMLQPGIVRGAA